MSSIHPIASVLPSLPGFIPVGQKIRGKHVFDYGIIAVDGGAIMLVTLFRSVQHSHFPPMLVEVGEWQHGTLWQNRDEVADNDQLTTRLAWAGNQPVIAVIEKGRDGRVVYVRLFQELLVDDLQLEPLEAFRLKEEAAYSLGLNLVVGATEQKLLRFEEQVVAGRENLGQRKAREQDKRSVREQREDERIQRVSLIMARPRIAGCVSGRLVEFVPVLASEWPSLDNGTLCAVIASIAENYSYGAVLEHFKLEKKPGKNPIKKGLEVSSTPPANNVVAFGPVTSGVKPDGQQTVVFTEGLVSKMTLPLFKTMAAAQIAREAGQVPLGYVAYDSIGERGLYTAEGLTVAKAKYEFVEDGNGKNKHVAA